MFSCLSKVDFWIGLSLPVVLAVLCFVGFLYYPFFLFCIIVFIVILIKAIKKKSRIVLLSLAAMIFFSIFIFLYLPFLFIVFVYLVYIPFFIIVIIYILRIMVVKKRWCAFFIFIACFSVLCLVFVFLGSLPSREYSFVQIYKGPSGDIYGGLGVLNNKPYFENGNSIFYDGKIISSVVFEKIKRNYNLESDTSVKLESRTDVLNDRKIFNKEVFGEIGGNYNAKPDRKINFVKGIKVSKYCTLYQGHSTYKLCDYYGPLVDGIRNDFTVLYKNNLPIYWNLGSPFQGTGASMVDGKLVSLIGEGSSHDLIIDGKKVKTPCKAILSVINSETDLYGLCSKDEILYLFKVVKNK